MFLLKSKQVKFFRNITLNNKKIDENLDLHLAFILILVEIKLISFYIYVFYNVHLKLNLNLNEFPYLLES